MAEDNDDNYSSFSIRDMAAFVFWGIFFLLCLTGTILALLGVSSREDQISPYPAPSPTVKEWNEPNFDNFDQDGFVGGQR